MAAGARGFLLWSLVYSIRQSVADKYHHDEYTTSSLNVIAIKEQKELLRTQGYPANEVLDFVNRFFKPEHFEHLRGRDNVFIVAPSTSRTNIVPLVLATELAERFGGTVVTRWATALSVTKAAKKGGIGKIREPVRFEATNPERLRSLAAQPHGHFVVVDDVVTTGETTDALREILLQHGVKTQQIVSLGQAEMRKVTSRDIERLADKLGPPDLHAEVAAVLTGKLKHRANYIERSLHENYRSEIRDYFQNEARRIGPGARTVHPGGERGGGELGAGNPRLQPGPAPEAGPPAGHSGESLRVGGNPHGRTGRRGSTPEAADDKVATVIDLRQRFANARDEPERAHLTEAARTLASDLAAGMSHTQRTRLQILVVEAVQGSVVFTPEKVIAQAEQSRTNSHEQSR